MLPNQSAPGFAIALDVLDADLGRSAQFVEAVGGADGGDGVGWDPGASVGCFGILQQSLEGRVEMDSGIDDPGHHGHVETTGRQSLVSDVDAITGLEVGEVAAGCIGSEVSGAGHDWRFRCRGGVG